MTDPGLPLRVARAVKRQTVLQVHRGTGLDRESISRYERGAMRPSRFALSVLREWYGEALTKAEATYGEVRSRECGGQVRA